MQIILSASDLRHSNINMCLKGLVRKMKRLFFGGVHPADKKELSANSELKQAKEPKLVTIPMSQHIGVPCTPLVAVGDTVKKGQKIGDGDGLCVPVHASVSGKVTAIETRRHPNGNDILSVIIENDFKGDLDTSMTAYEDYSGLSNDEIIEIIREAGIVGMGGATFATNIKAAASMEKVKTLIANACECEPYITSDDMLLRTCPEQVLEGMRIICQVLNPERVVLAVEENKKDAIEILKKELEKEEKIELKILPTRYPQGAEKQLVQAVTGLEIPPGQLPKAVGAAVFNVATYAYTYRAVCLGRPVTERIVTVSGEAVKNPGNFLAKIGTGFEDLIQEAGGLKDNTWKIIAGGPMMGIAQKDLSACTIKGTSSILCLSQEQNGEAKEENNCIRCGACLKVCPMNLQPMYLYAYEKKQQTEKLNSLNVMDCIECGCCSYTCPSKLHLVESIRKGKALAKEEKKS